ncbi:hypothetical protein MiTs_01873 [Microcystis aeruginosa NIES-2521]|uniref:Uncharacterized protein n=1 Tax=Microcystis aeruginosa NIES-2521 TaxID=2303983 RepID=A0A5A5RTK5_MICAE|nr:hypothetical protein MiTs_01873 [Microcystis aeruginosa NIES-2521]
MEPITVATIVALVFQTTVEKFTEAALEKINTLRQIIWNKLRLYRTCHVKLSTTRACKACILRL